MRSIFLFTFVFLIAMSGDLASAQRIDRKALVKRHNIVITKADSLCSLTVGNGKFAVTVDVTGLQSFPDFYAKGVPLGTESEWGWHSFKNINHYQFESSLKNYHLNGRDVSYAVQWNEPGINKEAADWFRQNPHRLQLGEFGLEIEKRDGSIAAIADLSNIHQELDLWTGIIHSHFSVDDIPIEVITCCHPGQDEVAVKIKSSLLKSGRARLFIRFPYPTGEWADVGNNWSENAEQFSVFTKTSNGGSIHHVLDSTEYWAALRWTGNMQVKERMKNYFILLPLTGIDSLECVLNFSSHPQKIMPPGFSETKTASATEWKKFWLSGAAVDFSSSKDPRAFELERRVILSQYLLRAQEAGSYPPQETGLTYNSWFGKPHLEMYWWHAVHYALWGRIDLLEKGLTWYSKVCGNAKKIASRQGYAGIRWQKMTDNNGEESPSSVGAFLIWQQPHFIYFAELCYREHKNISTLNKYKDLVFATADFMASFPVFEKENSRYILGKGVIPAQERYKPEVTFNPSFELAYWHYALSVAQEWRRRLKLPIDKKWQDVLDKLSSFPAQDGVYLAAESVPDSYTNPSYRSDHPIVLGVLGFLPLSKMVDSATLHRTFDLVWKVWNWNETWGWDFPFTAMTAARLGLPDKAIDALFMNESKNTYLINGHNYQDQRLRIYLPGNGALLTAVAMMCAGWDGCKEINPGIPKNKNWVVKWEGLKRMP